MARFFQFPVHKTNKSGGWKARIRPAASMNEAEAGTLTSTGGKSDCPSVPRCLADPVQISVFICLDLP